ncbi:hypothetical protein KM043_004009 [Ampulex compressa]|nr:hypothetical protein KM043_004009 [Ampulex compressa]
MVRGRKGGGRMEGAGVGPMLRRVEEGKRQRGKTRHDDFEEETRGHFDYPGRKILMLAEEPRRKTEGKGQIRSVYGRTSNPAVNETKRTKSSPNIAIVGEFFRIAS